MNSMKTRHKIHFRFFLLERDVPQPIPPPTKKIKDGPTPSDPDLKAREEVMKQYRIGAYGCMDDVPDYPLNEEWEDVKSDLNFQATLQA